MKIALVLEKFTISRGGAERSTYELACALAELGADVTLLAGKINTGDLDDLPFRTRQLDVKGTTRTQRWHSLERALTVHVSQNKYDVVHSMAPLFAADVYQPRGGSILHSGSRHIRSYNNPVPAAVKRATAWMNIGRRARINSERAICQRHDGPLLAALSEYVARQFRTDYGLPDERIRVIRNGVNTNRLRSEQAVSEGTELRSRYDCEGDLALFLFAAENPRLKGLGWLIRSAQQAAQQLTDPLRDFRIMVIGSGNFKSYRSLARQLRLDQRILFMGSTSHMPGLLQMCDAVVLPTYNDACSRMVLEALAVGKPAVTTAFNGAAEFLREGDYGFVIDRCDDVPALTDALLHLCDHNRQQQMCREIEADRLYEKVSMKRHARELLALYEQVGWVLNPPSNC
jgi:UDP-glucose:(heptosyl)LPS alpha-1,3-glucosyltransferase